MFDFMFCSRAHALYTTNMRLELLINKHIQRLNFVINLEQCFLTGVPRNPGVPWASLKGSATSFNGYIFFGKIVIIDLYAIISGD